MKHNYREADCCMNCKHSEVDCERTIMQTPDDPTTLLSCSEQEDEVNEYMVCDDFERAK